MENRRKLGKEDSLVHWWHDTCAARHLGLHAIAPTTWGMSPWRAIVVSKWKSRFRSGQKERPCDSETKYNAFLIPVFHSLHLIQKGHKQERATYRVWSLSTYLQVEQTSRQKKINKENMEKNQRKKKTTESPQSPSSHRKSLISECVGRGACSKVAVNNSQHNFCCWTAASSQLLFWRTCAR